MHNTTFHTVVVLLNDVAHQALGMFFSCASSPKRPPSPVSVGFFRRGPVRSVIRSSADYSTENVDDLIRGTVASCG